MNIMIILNDAMRKLFFVCIKNSSAHSEKHFRVKLSLFFAMGGWITHREGQSRRRNWWRGVELLTSIIDFSWRTFDTCSYQNASLFRDWPPLSSRWRVSLSLSAYKCWMTLLSHSFSHTREWINRQRDGRWSSNRPRLLIQYLMILDMCVVCSRKSIWGVRERWEECEWNRMISVAHTMLSEIRQRAVNLQLKCCSFFDWSAARFLSESLSMTSIRSHRSERTSC